jgi:hypothetical protein
MYSAAGREAGDAQGEAVTGQIKDLTPAQWEEVGRLRAGWLAVGTCCESADRPVAEAAVAQMYRLAGRSAPRLTWMDSPAAAAVAIAPLVRYFGETDHNALSLLNWPLKGRLRHTCEDALGLSLIMSLGRRLRDSLHASLVEGVIQPLRASLRASLGDLVRTSLGFALDEGFFGQQDAYWVPVYDIPRRLGIVTYDRQDAAWLDLWVALTSSCGWLWPYEGICTICERPQLVRTETGDPARGTLRLHCPDGPAMKFGDGWTVWAWHGRGVPSWVVENPTVDRIAAEPSTEIRRCAIESLGWETFAAQAQLTLVGACPDPGNADFDLELYDVPERLWGWPVRLLLCTNGTPELDGTRRRFGITVPVDITTPLAAAAWTFDDPSSPVRVTPESYAQIQRRT